MYTEILSISFSRRNKWLQRRQKETVRQRPWRTRRYRQSLSISRQRQRQRRKLWLCLRGRRYRAWYHLAFLHDRRGVISIVSHGLRRRRYRTWDLLAFLHGFVGDVRIVSHGLRRQRYRTWVRLVFLHDLLGDVRIVSHGLPTGASPFLWSNIRTRPVNKQHFHGTIRPLLLHVYTGLTPTRCIPPFVCMSLCVIMFTKYVTPLGLLSCGNHCCTAQLYPFKYFDWRDQ